MTNVMNPQQLMDLLIKGDLAFVEVNVCSTNSSVTAKDEKGKILFEKLNLDYNEDEIVQYRVTLQDFDEIPGMKIVSTNRESIVVKNS